MENQSPENNREGTGNPDFPQDAHSPIPPADNPAFNPPAQNPDIAYQQPPQYTTDQQQQFQPQYVQQGTAPVVNPFAQIDAKIKSQRSSFFLVIILSSINVVSVLFSLDFEFYFSLTFATIASAIGRALSEEVNSTAIKYAGVMIAVVAICVFVLLYVLSQKRKGAALAAAILFGFDCLLYLLFFFVFVEMDFSVILGAAFHGWALYSFIMLYVLMNRREKLQMQLDMQYQNQYPQF